ncbi:MAG: ABC transporter permease [bacterium]
MKEVDNKKRSWNYGYFSVILFLLLWEYVASQSIIDPIYIGTPHIIMVKLYQMFLKPDFYDSFKNSAQAFFIGYVLAVVFGAGFGLLLGTKKKLYQIMSPFVFTINSLPFVAILPLIIIWFGVGLVAKSFVVFLMVVSPVIIYTLDSTKTLDEGLLLMSKSFKASEWIKLKSIYFYHSLPYIFSGARVGVGRGIIAIVVSELYGFGMGMAYYIQYYGSTYQTDKLMANILLIVSFNFVLIYLLKKIQKKVVFWR